MPWDVDCLTRIYPGLPTNPRSFPWVGRQQRLLLPDPRPLEDTVGAAFFREAPSAPGVYLMRDAAGVVVYVGKARDLRQRLGNYRVANPDRMPRRLLRLLSTATRIDLLECSDEPAALAEEARLIRALRPKFNRAGVWPGQPWYLAWTVEARRISISLSQTTLSHFGPFHAGVVPLVRALTRLLWLSSHPELGHTGMPAGWLTGNLPNPVSLVASPESRPIFAELEPILGRYFAGDAEALSTWLADNLPAIREKWAQLLLEADLETVMEFVPKSPS